MANAVVTCKLEFNGQAYEDFSEFVDGSRTTAVVAEYMNKTGHGRTTQRPNFRLTNIRTAGTPALNLEDIVDGTFTAQYDDGTRINFTGVYTTEVGDETSNGTDVVSVEYSFGAATRSIEKKG